MEPVTASFWGFLLQRGIENWVVTGGRNGRNNSTFVCWWERSNGGKIGMWKTGLMGPFPWVGDRLKSGARVEGFFLDRNRHSPGVLVLKLEGSSESPGALIKATAARPHPPHTSDSLSLKWGPIICISDKISRKAFKNHWPTFMWTE